LRLINETGIPAAELIITPAYLAEIIKMIDENIINNSTGKALIDKVQASGKSPSAIVAEEGLAKVSDTNKIEEICKAIIIENPEAVANYRKGKTGLIGWFVGQVMKQMGGKADAQLTRQILENLLKE